MEVTYVKAIDRFDSVELDNVLDWSDMTVKSMYTIYSCSQCNEKIRFQTRAFEKVWKRRDWSNILREIALCFDKFACENGLNLKYFLDWQCPKCGLAARVLIESWAGGRHADYGFKCTRYLNTLRD